MTGPQKCSTCNRPLVWITTANGPKQVCPGAYCPGHQGATS